MTNLRSDVLVHRNMPHSPARNRCGANSLSVSSKSVSTVAVAVETGVITELSDSHDASSSAAGIVTLIAGLRPPCPSASQVDEHTQLFQLPVSA